MVNIIYIIVLLLGIGFLLPITEKLGKKVSNSIFFITLTAVSVISVQWLYAFIINGQTSLQFFTAGVKPPLSINLQLGLSESVFIASINILALIGAVYLIKHFNNIGIRSHVLYLLMILGLNGLVLTRDIFNIFVFLEITGISTYALIGSDLRLKSLIASFKYMLAGGVASIFLLLGIIFLYSNTGTLNIDGMIEASPLQSGLKIAGIAIFFLFFALLIEMKQFPANGWALDVYEASNPGISGIISAAGTSAILFALYKVMPLGNNLWFNTIAIIGIITFVVSNIMGMKQKNATRLLGYSSIGQLGLLLTAMGLGFLLGGIDKKFQFIIFALFISHFIAKSGLFWIAGIINKKDIKTWSILRTKPVLFFFTGSFMFSLLGFPPFPGFFGKWELIMTLANKHMFLWMTAILIGSLFEAVYLIRWFGYILKEKQENNENIKVEWSKNSSVFILGIILFVISGLYIIYNPIASMSFYFYPLAFIAFLFISDGILPAFIKNILSIAGVSYYGYIYFDQLSEFRFIFGVIFLAGGILTLIPGFVKRGKREGFYPSAIIMYVGLLGLLVAKDMFSFFTAWEFMTLGSYFLIIRGKRSQPHALSYMLFSLGGAYFIMFGFALAKVFSSTGGISLNVLNNVYANSGLIFTLLAIGFLTKTAAAGLHIWLPGAHAEAESDVSPMVSAVLLKAGVFGLIVIMISQLKINSTSIIYLLGWLGAITALLGNLMASFQEDAKKLLAYSSIAQLGYILFGLAIMSHIGWMAAIWYAMNHFLYKALLFLAVGAIVVKLKTHNMYEMGGLIKQMPFSFVSILIGIIALAGVPPLSGFGGKWLLYNAFILKGWYIQGAIIAFSGVVAFLYLYKLIHSIFLGPVKDKFRNVKEVSVWYLIPEYIIIITIMVLSAKPKILLGNIGNFLTKYMPDNLVEWKGNVASSYINGKIFGVWDATHIMMIIGIIFVVILGWLLFMSRKAQKVGMFNIVYSAERPESPQTTHFSYNMYSHYRKAVGFLAMPLVVNFWNFISDFIHSIADIVRRLYNGNGQAYIMHILGFMVIIYFVLFNGGLF